VRRFVVIGQTATGSPAFSLDDLPGTSGRLDVLLRAAQAALLVSHGLRRDTIVYLALLGDPAAPRVVRIDGRIAEYLRPDERSLGGRVRHALEWDATAPVFTSERQGIAVACAGIDAALQDAPGAAFYVLEEGGQDARTLHWSDPDPTFFVGDHLGFDPATRARLAALGAAPVSVGPISLHADAAVTVVHNELDRRVSPGR
jgi:tRNA (pseudouridine54-N1)-methyltransferase